MKNFNTSLLQYTLLIGIDLPCGTWNARNYFSEIWANTNGKWRERLTLKKVVGRGRGWQNVWLQQQIKKMLCTRGESIKQSEIEAEMINSFNRREIDKIRSKEKKLRVSEEEGHLFSELARWTSFRNGFSWECSSCPARSDEVWQLPVGRSEAQESSQCQNPAKKRLCRWQCPTKR